MKKEYKIFLLLSIQLYFSIIATAQSSKSIDSLNIFIGKSEHLDSILKKKAVTSLSYLEIINVVEAKIKMEHNIPVNIIDNAIAWISHPDGTFTNCDSIGIYLADRLYKRSKNIIQKIGLLKLQLEYIERTGNCIIKKQPNKLYELVFDLNKLEYELKIKNDLDYLIHTNMLGTEYAKQNDAEKAEYCFGKVMSYPYWIIGAEFPIEFRGCYEECITAGKNKLYLRRGDLKKLENTFFPYAYRYELEAVKKIYIEELGGKYKTPEEIIKEEDDEDKKNLKELKTKN